SRELSACTVSSTTPAGTIIQIARGAVSFFTKSSSEATRRAFACELLHVVLVHVERDALVAAAHQPPHHVRAHPPQAHHPNLHQIAPLTTAYVHNSSNSSLVSREVCSQFKSNLSSIFSGERLADRCVDCRQPCAHVRA